VPRAGTIDLVCRVSGCFLGKHSLVYDPYDGNYAPAYRSHAIMTAANTMLSGHVARQKLRQAVRSIADETPR